MTRATYDAIGDKFRSLWGKEAGWAHTVLFTADLRAFAERLSTKIEIKEVKQEDDATVLTETNIKAELLRPVSMKREFDEEKVSPIAFEKVTTKREVKRRRRT